MHVIGIVGRCYYNKDGQKIVQTHDSVRRFLCSRDDVVCITLLPQEDIDYLSIDKGTDSVSSKVDYLLELCDAFVVPGGTYQYQFDEYVLKYAISHDKPLLAICLGFQALCSMFAKERNQFDMSVRLDLEHHLGKGNEYKHDVMIQEHTKLMNIIGEKKIRVNSVHHDIVNFDMDTLVINAFSDDGIIEGVEYPNKKFILGVQWHPEYLVDDNSKKILNQFIQSIKKDS